MKGLVYETSVLDPDEVSNKAMFITTCDTLWCRLG